VIFTLLNCPPNFLWQEYLEQRFPGYTGPSTLAKGEKTVVVKRNLDVGNTIKKLALDQTVGATVNTVLFTAVIGALKGLGGGDIVDAIKQVSSKITDDVNPPLGPHEPYAEIVPRSLIERSV